MKTSALCIALLGAFSIASAAESDFSVKPPPNLSSSSVKQIPNSSSSTFECNSSSTGVCHYLVFAPSCSDTSTSSIQERTCRFTARPAFTLKAGEKRTLDQLPSDYLYCMKPEAMPSLDQCLKTPMSH